jgi:signal transduction histidine kinase
LAETLFDYLRRYVSFGPADEEALRQLHPLARPRFAEVAGAFYARILADPQARAVLQGGESQVGHLEVTLVQWLELLLTGPWDDAYFTRRCRIGRMHVRIKMPQHLMFGAMNVLRLHLEAILEQVGPPDRVPAMRAALAKILDLELGIMLHTYREDLEAQQARAERLATFGQLVGSIGHELRNPLGVMETSLYILRGRIGDDERAQRHAERIGEQLGIASGIISDLLEMIRERPLKRERLLLGKVIDEARALLRPGSTRLVLPSAEAGRVRVDGDPSQLRQVLVNLLQNGIEAAGEDGTVELRLSSSGPQIALEVEDSGPGVPDEVRHRLFEPLITTRPKGIGLGLALVKRIVDRHQGTVTCEPRGDLGGARFLVRLPAAEEKSP